MRFNCLKATEPLKGDSLLFTFKSPGVGFWSSFDQLWKDKKLSQSWSHPVVLNTRPLDWEPSTLTTKPKLQVETNIYVKEKRTAIISVQIIASHFANSEVNSCYCDCKVLNHTKYAKLFFSQRKFNSSTLYFSTLHRNYILILFIDCILILKEILHIPKITSQDEKSALQFLKKTNLQQAKSLATLGIFIAQ